MSNHLDSKLYWACWRGNHELASELLLQGANPNDELASVYRDTPLHLACRHGWLDIVKSLIESKGCDPHVKDCGSQTPLHYACRYGCEDIVRYLTLEQKCDARVTDGGKWTPLHCACWHGYTNIVRFLRSVCHILLQHTYALVNQLSWQSVCSLD